MMPTPSRSPFRFPVLALGTAAWLLAATPPADAQTVRVTVQADVAQAAREVRQAVDEAMPEVRHDLADALRELADGLSEASARLDRPGWSAGRAEQTDKQSRPLTLGPSGTLDLTAIEGDITVVAGTGAPTLEIVKVSRARTDAEAQQNLARVTVDVQDRGGRVVVKPLYGRPSVDVKVSYVATVPASVTVRAHNISGTISITGIRGDISAVNTSGPIALTDIRSASEVQTVDGSITITNAQADRPLELRSIAGAIALSGVKAPRLTASTVDGRVQIETTTCPDLTVGTLSGTIDFRSPLASNGHYELHTHSGPVHFQPTGEVGFQMDAQSFSGIVRIDPSLKLAASHMQQRTLSGTVGDGSAAVAITTFSGAIQVGPR